MALSCVVCGEGLGDCADCLAETVVGYERGQGATRPAREVGPQERAAIAVLARAGLLRPSRRRAAA